MTALYFMGLGEPEAVRARVYTGTDHEEAERQAFVHALATTGVLDAPAYDTWIAALSERGWVEGDLEPHPLGHVKRWRLSARGLAEWSDHRGRPPC